MSQNQGTGQGGQTRPPGRPGAMTMAMQAVNIKPAGPKVLRIGVIQGGKIVEERIIRKRETVTIGSSERNHFVINAAGISQRFELFQLVGSDYILNFTEAMSGRVGLPAGVQTLEQLRSTGAARNAGSHWQVKLNDNARGKVVVGDVTLLFQFVTPPPVQPRPQLPAAARGGFAKSIDWMFTAFVVFSFMVHFGFVVYLENADWPVKAGLGEVPQEYTELIMETAPPEPPEELPPIEDGDEQPAQDEGNAEKEQPKQKAEPAKEKPSKSGGEDDAPAGPDKGAEQAAVAEASARMATEAAAAAEALLLGSLSSEGGGALANVLSNGAVTGNAEEVLSQAAGVGVASGSSGGKLRTRSGGGEGRTKGLGSLGAAGGGGKAVKEGGAIAEKAPRGNIKSLDGGDIGGTGDFDTRKVTAMVKTRLGAIKQCYERQLRTNPALAGKVTIEFTIEQRGTVSKADAKVNTTNDPNVASCIVRVFRGMRFNPGPEGGSVTYSYPFVFAPQN